MLIQKIEEPQVAVSDINAIAARATGFLAQIREAMLAPFPRKIEPKFSSFRVQTLCGIEKRRFQYLIEKGEIPGGFQKGAGKSRIFRLDETIECVRNTCASRLRPAGSRGRVITVANYKGGVAKTSTAVTLAQGLTLKGHKVLLLDLDPQGTATQLAGFAPDAEITENETALPLLYGNESTPDYAIRPSYWHNLDVIPACAALNEAEFDIPGRLLSDRHFAFWDILRKGIAPVLDRYDCVVIDTPPSLGMITINALSATDGLIIPCPPRALDFASTSQFWHNFSDYVNRIPGLHGKSFDFVKVLPTMSDNSDISQVVMGWLQKSYGGHLFPFVIPSSKVASSTTATLSTVYDISDDDDAFSREAIQRIREPYDALSKAVNESLIAAWERDVKVAQPEIAA